MRVGQSQGILNPAASLRKLASGHSEQVPLQDSQLYPFSFCQPVVGIGRTVTERYVSRVSQAIVDNGQQCISANKSGADLG